MKKHVSFERPPVAKGGIARLAVFVCIAVIAVIAVLAFRGVFTQFQEDAVVIAFSGSDEAGSAQPTQFSLSIENTESIPLAEVMVFAQFPSSFSLAQSSPVPTQEGRNTWRLTDIAPSETRTVQYAGTFFGDAESLHTMQFEVRFTPQGYSLQYDRVITHAIRIRKTPLFVELRASDEAQAGESVNITARIQNHSDSELTDLEVTLNTSTAFHLEQTIPRGLLLRLAPGEEKSYLFSGRIDAETTDELLIVEVVVRKKGNTASIAKSAFPMRVSVRPVSLSLEQAGKIASPSSPAIARATYFAQGKSGIRDATLQIIISGNVDITHVDIELPSGSVIQRAINVKPITLTVTAADDPALSVVDSGTGGRFVIVIYPSERASGGTVSISAQMKGFTRGSEAPFVAASENLEVVYEGAVVPSVYLSEIGGGEFDIKITIQNFGERIHEILVTIPLPPSITVSSASFESGVFDQMPDGAVWRIPWVPGKNGENPGTIHGRIHVKAGSLTLKDFLNIIPRIPISWLNQADEPQSISIFPLTNT